MAAFQAQVLDVGAGGFGDPQAVEREQGDERVLGGRAEPGGDQERAELVAVQGGGVRLIIQPRPAHVRGRGVVEELFLHGVLVETGDGAQPPGDGGAGPAACFQLTGERLDVAAADREQRQRAEAAPGGELAQVQGVGLAGQAAVAGQEACQGEAFGVGEGRLDGSEGGGGGRCGHRAPPGTAEIREPRPAARPQQWNEERSVSRARPLRQITVRARSARHPEAGRRARPMLLCLVKGFPGRHG